MAAEDLEGFVLESTRSPGHPRGTSSPPLSHVRAVDCSPDILGPLKPLPPCDLGFY